MEEIKEMEHTKTEEALQLVRKEQDLVMRQNEKEKTKILQGSRKPRKDEEMAWAPPRNMSKWPYWERADGWKKASGVETEGEAEVPEIIIVSDAVDGTFADLDGESRSEQVEARLAL